MKAASTRSSVVQDHAHSRFGCQTYLGLLLPTEKVVNQIFKNDVLTRHDSWPCEIYSMKRKHFRQIVAKGVVQKLESYRQETIDTVRHIIHDTSIGILVSITACLIFGAQQITHFQEPYLILWRQGLNRWRILNTTGRHALGVHQPTEQRPELHRIQIQKDTSITILWKNLVPTSTEQLRQARTFDGGQSVSSCHEAGVSTHVQPEWWMLCKAVPIGSFKKNRGQTSNFSRVVCCTCYWKSVLLHGLIQYLKYSWCLSWSRVVLSS